MVARASSTLLLVKGEPATSTRVPSTSITRVIRMMESLPVLSSVESDRISRTDCHFVVASSGTACSWRVGAVEVHIMEFFHRVVHTCV